MAGRVDTEFDLPEVGTRVGVVLSMDRRQVRFIGWGTFEGLEYPPHVRVPTFEELRSKLLAPEEPDPGDDELRGRYKFLLEGSAAAQLLRDPKIKLDNGKIIWGSECWWGPEDKMREAIKGKEFLLVDVDDARKAAQDFRDMVKAEKARRAAQ